MLGATERFAGKPSTISVLGVPPESEPEPTATRAAVLPLRPLTDSKENNTNLTEAPTESTELTSVTVETQVLLKY